MIFFFLVLLGSILPDIDDGHSKVNQWSGFVGKILSLFSKHRGLFHSLLFYVLLFFILSFYSSFYYGRALFIGYLAHMVGDCVTRQGVAIFYPFSNFKFKGFVKVGGWVEWVIAVMLLIFIFRQVF